MRAGVGWGGVAWSPEQQLSKRMLKLLQVLSLPCSLCPEYSSSSRILSSSPCT